MPGMDILAIAQQGLQQAGSQVEKAAVRIANTSQGTDLPPDSVSLSDAMVSLLSSKNQFQADIAVAQTATEMEKKTLDLLA
jgi:hypothetical protein